MVEIIKAKKFSHVALSPECGVPYAAFCATALWSARDKKNEQVET